ncbi:hypothetical protein [Streptomyces specialis]|uniref:hypothetical protein n=1 Tax=Streptomyces specialis TaxID=498367 RepID=UPI001F1DC1F1|nr:hypothetical protein [Streptomyces specialis]
MFPVWRIRSVQARAAVARKEGYRRFEEEVLRWRARVTAHNEAERARVEAALLWHPVGLWSGPSRVDVFGGTADGWASLLATWGTSLLSPRRGLLVVDLSEQDVASGLAELTAAVGDAVTHIDLPAQAARLDLLGGMGADQVADVLAQAVHTARRPESRGDLRTLDAELIEAVVTRLAPPLTFRRLVAGLEVLQRTYDPANEQGPLQASEVTALSLHVDTVGSTGQVQDELRFLAATLKLLGREESLDTPPTAAASGALARLWPPTGLTVITTAHSQHRRKDLLDRVVFHRLLHDLRAPGLPGQHAALVIAGADRLGLENLEALARQCRRTGVRLVLMLERLRGELKELLGSSDSAAVLMRLGNAQDAAAAAEFIGRGHKMVLSQVTAQTGRTFTAGAGHSIGTSEQTGATTGVSFLRSRGWTWPWDRNPRRWTVSDSLTASRGHSWQETANLSQADSTSHSTTQARVYEFEVKPTTIQSLPPTAFILVENPPAGRRTIAGDCNPGITLLDRVAPAPHTHQGAYRR